MKRRLVLAVVIILAWLAFFAWQRQGIDEATRDTVSATAAP